MLRSDTHLIILFLIPLEIKQNYKPWHGHTSGISAAAEISSVLASSAVRLAARYTVQQMENERRVETLAGLGRIGWPRRAIPRHMERDIPASWRLLSRCSRRAEALATPPRRPLTRRTLEEEEDPCLGGGPMLGSIGGKMTVTVVQQDGG